MHETLAAALGSTVQQIAALDTGDDDLFLAGVMAHEAACLDVAALPQRVLTSNAPALAALVDATARMDAAIAARREAIAHRLSALAASRQANSAYSAAPLSPSFPTHEA